MPNKSIINDSDKNQRADVLLANEYSQYSRSALSKLFDLGDVTIDGVVLKAGDKIKPKQKFSVDISKITKQADKIELPILYEDQDIIVIDKPAGIISHARGIYWDEASVASFVRDRVSDLSGERAGIVHRLDRATSGVMVCAKNPQSLKYLQKQFSDRKVKKTYIAVIEGTLDPTEAIIDIPIARNLKKPVTFKVDKEGKYAVTNYKVIETNGQYSLLELVPTTGRTHQLRVHLSYLKHPILGDALYNGKLQDRLYLHAKSLEITLPNHERRVFASKLPKNFLDLLK